MEDRIKKIIAEQLGADESSIQDDSFLRENLEADELDYIELTLALESEFSITLNETQLKDLKTVGSLIDYVKSLGTQAQKT